MTSEREQERWIAERMSHIEASGIRKIFELARSLKDPVNLSIGQPDFDVPEPIKAAAHAAIDLDRRLGQLDHLAVPLIVLGQIYQCHGDPDRAIAHYREALALAEDAEEPQLLFPCYDGLATALLDLGDEGHAEEFMQKAQAVCVQAPHARR